MVRTVRKIWEIVGRFKRRCRSKGWRVIEGEDLIERNKELHNFLWTRKINPSTFERVAGEKTATIQEGASYRPIDVSYNAWICATPLSDSLKETIAKNPKLMNRNAVYDLSKIHVEKTARKLNNTVSEIFQEFESFLKDEFQFEVRPIQIQVP